MSNLHVKTDAAEPAPPPSITPATARHHTRLGSAARSLTFFVFFFAIYLPVAVGLVQRLVLLPIVTFAPRRRRPIVRRWLKLHARVLLRLVRRLLDVRVYMRGSLPDEPAIVLMNHQSVLDILVVLDQVNGPQLLIPTRDRYFRGIPGISPVLRLALFPPITQGKKGSRSDLSGIADAADKVARGENSFFIFPEGHRTRDGNIQRFMTRGLKLTLSRAKRPVYCIVADGMWHARTFADATLRFAGTNARATIVGPFDPPDDADIDGFIEMLRNRMIDTLAELRSLSEPDVVASFRLLPD
jgi:1-acyl-sn-glycerol-3-phosphate acyltransferase